MRLASSRDEIIRKYSEMIDEHPDSPRASSGKYLALAFDEYDAQVVSVLREMITEWETRLGEDDKTLYSLGLRRAIDELIGESSV